MANQSTTGVIDFDLVDYAELTAYSRLFYDEVLQNQFMLQQYLPDNTIDDLQYSLPRGGYTDVDAAEYRSWDVPAPMTGRQGIARVRGELAPISRGIPLTEEEGLRLRSLLRNTDTDPRVAQIYADTERMLRSVAVRVELARGDLLVDGKVTLAENDLQLEADFEVPVGNFNTPAVAWTVANAATAVPVTDLLDIAEDMAAVGADMSNFDLVLSRSKLPALQLNEQLRDFAASGGTTPQRINQATIQSIFDDEGLPRIVTYDSVFRVDGVQTRPIPANKAILVPRSGAGDAMGATLFGPTAESVLLAERGVIEASQAPGLIAVVLENTHPVQTTTVAAATALPVLLNPELLFPMTIG